MKQNTLLLTGFLLCACSAHDGGQTGDAQNPPSEPTTSASKAPAYVYTIDLGDQHKITYRAYPDGELIIAEQARNEGQAVGAKRDLAGQRPIDAFRALHPGSAIPKELSDLQTFLDRVAAEAPAPEGPAETTAGQSFAPDAELIPKMMTSDPATFGNAYGCYFGWDVYNFCALNRIDWGYGSATSRWAIYKVAPYLGNILVSLKINNVVFNVDPVPQGFFRWYAARGNIHKHNLGDHWNPQIYWYPDMVNHRIDILDATGDQFHFSGRFHNYKIHQHTCAEIWGNDFAQPGAIYGPCIHHYQ